MTTLVAAVFVFVPMMMLALWFNDHIHSLEPNPSDTVAGGRLRVGEGGAVGGSPGSSSLALVERAEALHDSVTAYSALEAIQSESEGTDGAPRKRPEIGLSRTKLALAESRVRLLLAEIERQPAHLAKAATRLESAAREFEPCLAPEAWAWIELSRAKVALARIAAGSADAAKIHPIDIAHGLWKIRLLPEGEPNFRDQVMQEFVKATHLAALGQGPTRLDGSSLSVSRRQPPRNTDGPGPSDA
jgi:hypothetical protein